MALYNGYTFGLYHNPDCYMYPGSCLNNRSMVEISNYTRASGDGSPIVILSALFFAIFKLNVGKHNYC